jgi:hypothetical protein
MRRVPHALLALTALLSCAGSGLAAPPDPFAAFGLVRFDSGIRAPEFTLPDLKGNPVSISSPAGSAAILVFWATW